MDWHTLDELMFLSDLGTHCPEARKQQRSRLELLRSYADTMPARSRWGGVDSDRVREHITKLIAEEERRCRT